VSETGGGGGGLCLINREFKIVRSIVELGLGSNYVVYMQIHRESNTIHLRPHTSKGCSGTNASMKITVMLSNGPRP